MRILVVGGGGREHAIIKKLKENTKKLQNQLMLELQKVVLQNNLKSQLHITQQHTFYNKLL